MTRSIAMTPNGRFLALRRDVRIEIVDLQGTAPRVQIDAPDHAVFAWVGSELWVGGDPLRRFRADASELSRGVTLASEQRLASLTPGCGRDVATVIAVADRV